MLAEIGAHFCLPLVAVARPALLIRNGRNKECKDLEGGEDVLLERKGQGRQKGRAPGHQLSCRIQEAHLRLLPQAKDSPPAPQPQVPEEVSCPPTTAGRVPRYRFVRLMLLI